MTHLYMKEEIRIKEIYEKISNFSEIQRESHDLVIEAMIRICLVYCAGRAWTIDDFDKKLNELKNTYVNKYLN